jgi:hypothetical protein
LIRLLFGQGFQPPWWVAAATTAGVLLATGSLVLNQVLVATGSEARLPLAWAIALIGFGLTIAVTGWSPLARVVAGFVIGEVIAVIGLAVAAPYGEPGRVSRAVVSPIEPEGLSPQSTDPAKGTQG